MSDRPTLVHTSRPAPKQFRQRVAQAFTLLSMAALGYGYLLIPKLYNFIQHNTGEQPLKLEGDGIFYLLMAPVVAGLCSILSLALHRTRRAWFLLLLSFVTFMLGNVVWGGLLDL